MEWGGGGVVLWLGICVKVAVEGISWICILSTPHPPPLSLSLSPFLKGGFLSLPRILYYKWQLFEISAPKAGFMAQCCVMWEGGIITGYIVSNNIW